MRLARNLLIALMALLNLSWSSRQYHGLITDHYGIVTESDLIEEERKCAFIQPFPPTRAGCAPYWQCLEPDEIHLACTPGEWAIEVDGILGSPIFWIREGNITHRYHTRRNFSMETCEMWLTEWNDVMDGENVVCLSGRFINRVNDDKHDCGVKETHYHWIIDRMKSLRGEWSYFHRD